MNLHEIDFQNLIPIDGYGDGFFRVGGQLHNGAMIAAGGEPVQWGGYADTSQILALADAIDILIVGTGAQMVQIPAEFRKSIEAAGMGIELMSSPSACRTYNVLLSEGRRIAIAALPV